MSFLSYIDIGFATSRLNGCGNAQVVRGGYCLHARCSTSAPQCLRDSLLDLLDVGPESSGPTREFGGEYGPCSAGIGAQRASRMVKRAPESPGKLLALAAPR